MANLSSWWALLVHLHPFPEIKDFPMIRHSFRMSGLPDSAMYFPKIVNVAILMWRLPRTAKALSNFGAFSTWSWSPIIAITKSHVTQISCFQFSSATFWAFFIVSATTATNVGDWFIWGRWMLCLWVIYLQKGSNFSLPTLAHCYLRLYRTIQSLSQKTPELVLLFLSHQFMVSCQRILFSVSFCKALCPTQLPQNFFFFFNSEKHQTWQQDFPYPYAY